MIKNIFFSGGGLKGWAYVGSIRALEEVKELINLEHVIGTSIGSLFGLLYLLKIDWKDILDYIININIKEIADVDIDNILVNQSIMKGHLYKEYAKKLISRKVNPELTFMELFTMTGVQFTVNAFNITKSLHEYFNYKLTPDVKIIDAVIASSSIPIIFPAYSIGDSYYYDGSICTCHPVELVEDLGTIILDLGTYYNNNSNPTNNNIGNVLYAISTLTSNNINKNFDRYLLFDVIDYRYINDMVNFDQTKDDVFNIYIQGYFLTKKMLYNNFIALPPPP
jgi:predicted acylesterase/phospholipase RssA